MPQSDTELVLNQIKSSRHQDHINGLYNGVGESLKHAGAPTNNILLSTISAELKRMNDQSMTSSSRLESHLSNISSSLDSLCLLMEAQNEMLASSSMKESTTTTRISQTEVSKTHWYYAGTKLVSRYHGYACILSHLMSMVETRMEVNDIHYPDSVDCNFNTMQNLVRIVCGNRSSLPNLTQRDTIITKDRDSQAFNQLYPIIASSQMDTPTSLIESQLSKIVTPVTRGIMQDIEWIRQRLVYMQGILSIKQVDILASISMPFKTDDDELQCNISKLKPKSSHPLCRDIMDLIKLKKDEFIILRLKNEAIQVAYEKASQHSGQKK